MRILLAGSSVAALTLLSGCTIQRAIAAQECADFYEHTRDRQVNEEQLKATCTCAVEREAARQTPIASVPPRPRPGLPEFRRHLPDCLQANGGSATGVAARESSGAPPSLPIFDPATGQVTEPAGDVMRGPGDAGYEGGGALPPGMLPGVPPPPAVRSDRGNEADSAIENANRAADEVNREMENAMRAIEGR